MGAHGWDIDVNLCVCVADFRWRVEGRARRLSRHHLPYAHRKRFENAFRWVVQECRARGHVLSHGDAWLWPGSGVGGVWLGYRSHEGTDASSYLRGRRLALGGTPRDVPVASGHAADRVNLYSLFGALWANWLR